MKNKRIFNLISIIIGIFICFGFSKIQATEIISTFTGETLTRSNLQTVAEANILSTTSTIVPITLGISESEYQTNNGNVYWAIKDASGTYKDIYCLNLSRGFGAPDGNITNSNSTKEYKNQYNLNSITDTEYKTLTGLTIENKNKILWILNNSLTSSDTLSVILNVASQKVDITSIGLTSSDTEEFIKEDMQSNTRESTKLTFDDIKIVQQIAIWHYTNQGSIFDNTISAICNSEGNQISALMRENIDIYGYGVGPYIRNGLVKQAKLNALYQYFIDGAESASSQTAVIPTLSLSNSNVKVNVPESGDSYIVGPFSLTGENTEIIKEITTSVNKDYTLLDAFKKEVSNQDFSKVIGSEFYLKIAETEVTETTKIELSLEYKYDLKELIFLTDKDDPTNTQPVVLVKSIEKSNTINTNANIELTEVTVKKVWDDNTNQDGKRPGSIEINLLADEIKIDSTIVTADSEGKWEYKFTKLLKNKDGKEVTYSVTENAVSSYTTSITGDVTNRFVITNTHIPETIDINGTKTWEDNNDQDGKRPDSITVSLYANGEKVNSQTVTSPWTYSFTNLPKYENGTEIVYTIKEDAVTDYTTQINGYNITNSYTPGIVSKSVEKKWEDSNNQDGVRPTSVNVQLYADDEAKGESITLNAENNWTYTWTELPAKKNGKDIEYTVKELDLEGNAVENEENYDSNYKATYSEEDITTIITNTHNPKEITGKYNVKLTKVNEEGNSLVGSKFIVTDKAGGTTELDLTSEATAVILENVDITSTDEITLKYTIEESVVPNGYEAIDKTDIYIKATVVKNEDNYEISGIELVDKDGKAVTVRDNPITINEDNNTIEIKVKNTPIQKKFDLALRKFITKVNGVEYSREPIIDTSKLGTVVDEKTVTTATYKHSKQPIAVQKGDIVTYTIRVYNEGEMDGYVNEITDYLPANLLPIIDGVEGINSEKYKEEIKFNNNWLWEFSGNGEIVKTKITAADKSSSLPEIAEDKQEDARLLKAYAEGTDKLDYIDVQIKCLVTDDAVSGGYLTNIAEITEAQDINGAKGDGSDSELTNADISNLSNYKNSEAINSTVDTYIQGQEDDDDFEKLVVKEFDLALRKFITKVNETLYSREPVVDTSKLRTTVDGKTITTAIYNHSKEPVIVERGDLVTYKIRIYNEGTLDGFVNEITDNIPEGLEFLPDSSVNVSYKWRMIDSEGNETEDVSKAVIIVTDYLSDNDKNNVIKASSDVDGVKTLSYKDVEVQFKVIAKAEKLKDNLIINEAQISADSDRDIDSVPNRDEKYNYTAGNNEDDIDYEPIKLKYFDLALKKFVTKVNSTEYNNRYPEIIYNEDGSITYNHTKDPVLVTTGDIVIYTIRVYNEGEKDGTATEITDNLPEGLEFLPDNEINKQYSWKLIDEEGNITEDITKAKKFATEALKDEIIDALIIKDGQKVLSYKDVQIAFKVIETNTSAKILINKAEISEDSDDDVDSTPENGIETEDDTDKEYVKVQYFDLSIKKWITASKVTYNGKTTTTKTGFADDSEGIAKVDLVASKMKKTTVKFVYSIKVTNEGELPGYAYEVKDYIPKGLKFVAEDNKDWKELEDGTVVTEKLKETLLNPGESATVEIVLTWKNSTTNTGLKTNYAEISKDSADDIDSTPDNYNLKEDDIDDAQILLSIKTAGTKTYIGLVLLTVTILAGGVFLIKKYVIR